MAACPVQQLSGGSVSQRQHSGESGRGAVVALDLLVQLGPFGALVPRQLIFERAVSLKIVGFGHLAANPYNMTLVPRTSGVSHQL